MLGKDEKQTFVSIDFMTQKSSKHPSTSLDQNEHAFNFVGDVQFGIVTVNSTVLGSAVDATRRPGYSTPHSAGVNMLRNATFSGFGRSFSGMVQILGFSGNSTDRPRASTVEVLSVVGPIAGSGTLEAVKAQHV